MKIKNKILLFTLYLTLTLIAPTSMHYAQEGWSVSASLQYSGGNYTYSNSNKIFYLYGSGGYQTNNWSVSISIPIVTQSYGGVGLVGGMMLPNGNNDYNKSYHNSEMMQNNILMNNHSTSLFSHTGLGDISIYGSYNLFEDNLSSFSLTLNSFMKIPTANSSLGLGTGEFDYGFSGTVRKIFNSYIGFVDLGYIQIGDPPNIDYKNPLSFGLGIGKILDGGNYSLLLYYQAYTTIIKDYDAPKLLSLGFNYMIKPTLTLSLIGAVGLSKVTSDFSVSTGLEWNL